MDSFDFVVIGGGIAGTSAACELAAHGSVLLLERESQLAYHSTGRSAAVLTENYGNEVIRLLTLASRAMLESPPAHFGDAPLFSPRGMMWIATEAQAALLDDAVRFGQRYVPSIQRLDAAQAYALCPAIRAGSIACAMLEPNAMDLDVHAIHQGFLRGLRARGGVVRTRFDVRGLARDGQRWRMQGRDVACAAGVVVNAAGGWADEVAVHAAARPVGLVAKRRTGILVDPPHVAGWRDWPCVIDVEERFYFKPEGAAIMASLGDATPVPPCDVQPEELDVALTVERIETATSLQIRRLKHRWAGLRTFAPDGSPVVGFDPNVAHFFWLAGQGGYGVMTAPALAGITAALAVGSAVPAELDARGLDSRSLSPARAALAAARSGQSDCVGRQTTVESARR